MFVHVVPEVAAPAGPASQKTGTIDATRATAMAKLKARARFGSVMIAFKEVPNRIQVELERRPRVVNTPVISPMFAGNAATAA
jgi:hypothetical protein